MRQFVIESSFCQFTNVTCHDAHTLQPQFSVCAHATHTLIIHDTLIDELIIHKIKVQYKILHMIKV